MSPGLQLILSTTLAAVSPGCSWAHPGANPYRGDLVQAVDDFDLPKATRAALRARMRAHRPTDIVTITRDDIVSRSGDGTSYTDLREMHSGHGQVCHGEVDRSAWRATRRERALVYCAGDACVIVPAICGNVSLVSRKPDRAAALDDSPIDIEPAAGPSPTSPGTPSRGAPPTGGPLGFIPMPGDGGDVPIVPIVPGTPVLPPGDGGGGGDSPGSGGGIPIGNNPPCCDTPPIGPVGPGGPPVTPPPPPVPEAPTALLLLAGLALSWPLHRGHGRRA